MLETTRRAETLSWISAYRRETNGREIGRCTYSIRLKKPNHVRLEVRDETDGTLSGVLVGDGEWFWIYWPNGKPQYPFERFGEYARAYEKHRTSFYMRKPSPPGRHSLAHETSLLGGGMGMTILDPSTFHGHTDSLYNLIDGVRFIEEERVGDERCDVVEVHMMRHQRIRTLWISRRDHLPRKMKEVVRAREDIITHEAWSEVAIDKEMAGNAFTWHPPEGWMKWRQPSADEGLLLPGVEAPDFDLADLDGSKVKLSNHRGKAVVLYIWKSG
jgi:outer membrane lipoprotein-sorting protein